MLPPTEDALSTAFNAPPRRKTKMSSGAVALCKHFERGGASELGKAHQFWPLPVGSNDNKTNLAAGVLARMLRDACWKNVMLLHPGVAVYEIRNSLGYGMRWTLEVERIDNPAEACCENPEDMLLDLQSPNEGDWRVTKITFRGFLEPILGLDHELDAADA